MSRMKDLYIATVEDLEREGLSYEEASERAYDLMMDRLADQADFLRDQEKERQWG